MAFTDVTNIPLHQIDTTVEVIRKGDGSHDGDDVVVTSTLEITADIAAEEAVLLLPLAASAQFKPIVRYTSDDIKQSSFEFDDVDRSELDEAVIRRLEAIEDGASKKEQRALATAISRAARSFSQAVIKVKPGQRQLRISYAISSNKVADREFEFEVVGPLPSFVIQGGGSIGLTALLARATTLVSAIGLQDPNNPGSEVAKQECDLAGRKLVGWFWQNDPLFRVRYRY